MGVKKRKFRESWSWTCTNCRLLEHKLAELFLRLSEKDDLIRQLRDDLLDLREDLRHATRAAYLGVEGARRWLAEHIGYDLRQVAKCPRCTGIKTAPMNPDRVGARFVCKSCGQVFFVIKCLSASPEHIRQAYQEARQEEELTVEVLPEDDPYRTVGRTLNWAKMFPRKKD